MWNYTCHWFWVMWVWASLVNQFTFMQSLRIISVLEASFLSYVNAKSPNWMEVNSGKSSQSNHITINHSQTQHENNHWMHTYHRRVIWEKACLIIISLWMRVLCNSRDGAVKNASWPNWMEVNSGKSSQSLIPQSITLKHNTRTFTECTCTKHKWFERRQV